MSHYDSEITAAEHEEIRAPEAPDREKTRPAVQASDDQWVDSQVVDDSSNRSIPRRHDLDALRATAMLMGIGLHVALAYLTVHIWPIPEENTHKFFDWLFTSIHGFRMHLFFMISGFFTAMLWRKRGLKNLCKHRAMRIGLPVVVFPIPLLIATVIIIYGNAILVGSRGDQRIEPGSIWAATKHHNEERLREILAAPDGKALVDEPDPVFQMTPLHWAAVTGNLEAADSLMAVGADPSTLNDEHMTPLSLASAMGQLKIAERLIKEGANVNHLDYREKTPLDYLRAPIEPNEMIALRYQIEVQRHELEQRRKKLAEMLSNAGAKRALELRLETSEKAGGLLFSLESLARRYLRFSKSQVFEALQVFGHLWFLWFLILLMVPFIAYVWVANAIGIRRIPTWLFQNPWVLLWIVPITVALQWFHGLREPTFGTDTSVALFPPPHILGLYAIFFFFGVLYFDADDDQSRRFTWGWWLMLPMALGVIFPIAYGLTYPTSNPWVYQYIEPAWIRPLNVVLQSAYAWMMTIGLMGLFGKICAKENSTIRYISDSSYWLYITHMPLVFLVQAIVAPPDIHAFIKFTLSCVLVTGVLLVSYEVMVRYTFIGTILNGRRTRPQKKIGGEASPANA